MKYLKFIYILPILSLAVGCASSNTRKPSSVEDSDSTATLELEQRMRRGGEIRMNVVRNRSGQSILVTVRFQNCNAVLATDNTQKNYVRCQLTLANAEPFRASVEGILSGNTRRFSLHFEDSDSQGHAQYDVKADVHLTWNPDRVVNGQRLEGSFTGTGSIVGYMYRESGGTQLRIELDEQIDIPLRQ